MPAARYANEQLPDPGQEAQAKALMATLRCLVCQGQSIADSDAEMAGDMRALVRTRIQAGEKPEAIRKWLIERYGDWVSYKPPLDGLTWPLWVMPIVFLLLGGWLVRGRFKRRGKS
jgi:cytochrome c-type biogenesis protein CcmH